MKKSILTLSILTLAASVALQNAVAQETVTTTTTADGTVQQIMPDSSQIMVTTSASTTPVKYTYTKSTTFVDAAGNTVSYTAIKPNTPAKIYYVKQGDSYVVTKYVVGPAASTTSQTVTTPATSETTVVAPATTVTTPAMSTTEETTTTTTTKGEK